MAHCEGKCDIPHAIVLIHALMKNIAEKILPGSRDRSVEEHQDDEKHYTEEFLKLVKFVVDDGHHPECMTRFLNRQWITKNDLNVPRFCWDDDATLLDVAIQGQLFDFAVLLVQHGCDPLVTGGKRYTLGGTILSMCAFITDTHYNRFAEKFLINIVSGSVHEDFVRKIFGNLTPYDLNRIFDIRNNLFPMFSHLNERNILRICELSMKYGTNLDYCASYDKDKSSRSLLTVLVERYGTTKYESISFFSRILEVLGDYDFPLVSDDFVRIASFVRSDLMHGNALQKLDRYIAQFREKTEEIHKLLWNVIPQPIAEEVELGLVILPKPPNKPVQTVDVAEHEVEHEVEHGADGDFEEEDSDEESYEVIY